MIEVISRIKEAEAAAEDLKKQGTQMAKEIEANAHLAGKQAYEKIKAEGAAQAAALLEQAKQQADQMLAENQAQAADESQKLAAGAAGRLDSAAALIVERIVGAK